MDLKFCNFQEEITSDYRPSVQLAATLFMNVDAFGDGSWNEASALAER